MRSRNDRLSPVTGRGLAWNLDWNLLRTFMVVAREGGITKAALSLGLKQPSVSNALKRLERQLGFRLAYRGPRSFRLTREGEAIYGECEEMFGTIGRLPHVGEERTGSARGHVSIVLASHVMTPMLDDALQRFHQANPEATISISVKGSSEVVETVRAKQATLGICLLAAPVEGLESSLFYREHFGFYCGPPHPLFGRDDVTLDDLRGQTRVTFYTDRLGDVLHPVAALRREAQFGELVTGVSNNLEEVRRMIIAGLGIGPLPNHVVAQDVRNGMLWRLLGRQHAVAVDVYLLHNPRTALSGAETEFMAMLNQEITSRPQALRTYGAAAKGARGSES